jgi:hypothetical protein
VSNDASKGGGGDPTPLAVVGATDLERRLISAAAAEQPSDEMTRRMAAALGFTAATSAAASMAAAATATATKVAAVKSISGWVVAGTLAAVVTGGAIAVWREGVPSASPAPAAVVAVAPAPAPVPAEVVAPGPEPVQPGPAPAAARTPAPRRYVAPARPSDDLRAEIALVDAARAALETGNPERALALLRRYTASYPGGTFTPETSALRIESLAAAGRGDEARALARDFVARYPAGPLSERIARFTTAR